MILAERLRPGAEIAAELVEGQRQIDLLLLHNARLAAELDASGYWEEEGSNSAIDWVRFNCHLADKAAGDLIAVGERPENLAESAQAMEQGEIGFAHVVVLARTAEAVGDLFDEKKLLQLARKHSPGKFYYKCLHYRHSVDAAGYARNQADLHEERRLSLSMAEDGCLLINGVLDPVGGAAVRTALEPLAKPSGDERNRDQRMADALVELATHGGKLKVQMQVTSSIETLLGLVGAPGAEAEFSLPISSKTVERWACDCSITRVLMKDSVVIDVGRAERRVKGPRRRALIARDKHCQWTGCERPASWCDAHHFIHWLRGGGGEIENQLLLCHRHHRMVHEGDWQLVKTADGNILTIAPTVTFGLPRGPD
jgi:hypothetical protein